MQKDGFKVLAAKTLAVITASMGFFSGSEAKADTAPAITDGSEETNLFKHRPQLVLRLNTSDGGPLLAMHTSHRSHSSHSSHVSGSSSGHYSHSSHSSHSSHYSSSPTYTPGNTVPYSLPKGSVTKKQPIHSRQIDTTYSSPAKKQVIIYEGLQVLQRVLVKGMEGEDVAAMQDLLVAMNYEIDIRAFFGNLTERSVKQFQSSHGLTADGKVGNKTFMALQNK
ncbi:MAG: peptidoglycan-binding domain-containing protein [Bacteroidota bacterium]